MDLDEGQHDAPPPSSPSPPPPSPSPSPLDTDLATRTATLLNRLSVLSSTPATSPTTLINSEHHATEQWIPLIPLADLSLLLSVIPTAQLPSNLPFAVAPASATPATRAHLLDTLARLALEPSLTVEVVSAFRPVAVALVGRWIELLGLSDEGRWRQGDAGVEQAAGERDAVEKVWRAVVRVLPIMNEEAMPYVLLSFANRGRIH